MSHETTLYMKYDRKNHFDAPQFTRSNHRYRGSRESEKINLEIQQFNLAIQQIGSRLSDIRDMNKEFGQVLFEGGTVEGVKDFDQEAIELQGLQSLANRLEALKTKVNLLPESAEALGRFTETFQRRF